MELPTLSVPALPYGISLANLINAPVLMGVLILFSLVYLIITGVLVYHWYSYGMRSPGIIVAETLFLFISLVLFVFAGLAISYY